MGILTRFNNHHFLKSVAVLMTGTVIAQLFSFFISPALTRLYTPEEMGDYNLYLRIIGFIAALATARFELSLPLPKKDEHSYLLYRLAFRIAIFMLVGLSILSLFYFLFTGFDSYLIGFVAICISSAMFLVFSGLGTNWAIRKKKFKRISIEKITRSGVNNTLRLIFGLMGMNSFGLLLGGLFGMIASAFIFLPSWLKINKLYAPLKSKKKTAALISTYKEFPTINLPHGLVDLGRDLLIAFLLIYYFSKDIFGWYSHSYAILQLPASIVGMSIGQVFFSRCSELVNEGKSTLPLLKKTIRTLLFLAIPPFTIIFFFGTPLFSFVFGDNWANSGMYSEIMTIWLFTGFIATVVSTLPTVLHRQKEFFYLGLGSTFIQLFSFGILPLIIGKSSESFVSILWFVSIVQSLYFCFVMFALLQFSKKGMKRK